MIFIKFITIYTFHQYFGLFFNNNRPAKSGKDRNSNKMYEETSNNMNEKASSNMYEETSNNMNDDDDDDVDMKNFGTDNDDSRSNKEVNNDNSNDSQNTKIHIQLDINNKEEILNHLKRPSELQRHCW